MVARYVCVAIMMSLALGLAGPGPMAQGKADEVATGIAPSARPWILVSLGPTGCSGGCMNVFSTIKQLYRQAFARVAERAREMLARSGAKMRLRDWVGNPGIFA